MIKDGNLIGRGADDKGRDGRLLRLEDLKGPGVHFNKKVRFIVGTDEEADWTGIPLLRLNQRRLWFSHTGRRVPGDQRGKGPGFNVLDLPGGNDGDLLKSLTPGCASTWYPEETTAVVEVADNEDLVTRHGLLDETRLRIHRLNPTAPTLK